jgi:hypothetical protein
VKEEDAACCGREAVEAAACQGTDDILASALMSTAKFHRPIESLIREMDQMLCRHRKASVACIRGQGNQPFGQSEWANSRILLSVDLSYV